MGSNEERQQHTNRTLPAAEQIPHALRSQQRLDLRGFGMADRPDDVFIHAEVSMEETAPKKTSSQRLVFA
jgi:hypothetical protein